MKLKYRLGDASVEYQSIISTLDRAGFEMTEGDDYTLYLGSSKYEYPNL